MDKTLTPFPNNRKSKTCTGLSRSIQNLKFPVVVGAILLALSFPAEAEEVGKVYRIGFVHSSGSPGTFSPDFEAFLQGLHKLGYVEGHNFLIEHRYGEGRLDRMPNLVKELVHQKVDVIVVTNQVAIRAAKKATQTIPIVMVSSVDPVAAGHVNSLARPGGNITGLSRLSKELSAKRVELLKGTSNNRFLISIGSLSMN